MTHHSRVGKNKELLLCCVLAAVYLFTQCMSLNVSFYVHRAYICLFLVSDSGDAVSSGDADPQIQLVNHCD